MAGMSKAELALKGASAKAYQNSDEGKKINIAFFTCGGIFYITFIIVCAAAYWGNLDGKDAICCATYNVDTPVPCTSTTSTRRL